MPDVVIWYKAIFILFIFQICDTIILPIQDLPRPAYTTGIKTTIRKNDSPYTLQNYSRVVVHNRPDSPGAKYVVTKSDQIKSVYPVFNGQRHENYQNVLQTKSHTKIDVGQSTTPNRTIIKRKIEAKTLEIYSKCPSGATGQFIYSASCNQFLNCWKGRGTVQNCAPGTLFNPKSLECDFPDKVECVTGPRSNSLENIRVEKSIQQATCPEGFSGIIPDYFDCSKFINCNNGQENKMDCAPGTLFDMQKNMCNYPDQTTCFNGENSLDVRTIHTQSYSNELNQRNTDRFSQTNRQHCNPATKSCGYGQRTYDNQEQNQYPASSTIQNHNIIRGCNPAYKNCGQKSPTYVQYSTSTFGESGNDLGNGQSSVQTHTVTQGCNPTYQNCGFNQQRPTFNQGQNQYPTSTYEQSGSDLSEGQSTIQTDTLTQGCNPATKNCEFGQHRPRYNQGQSQYPTSTYGQSETGLSRGQSSIQSHTVTQGCNPATKNCGFGQQRPTYNQGQNQYSTSTYGESETNLSGGQSSVTQKCNPAYQNCGLGQQRPTYNKGQNQYSSSTYGQSGTDLSEGQSTIQTDTLTQGCNSATKNCEFGQQRPRYNQGQSQYPTATYGQSGTDLSGGQSAIPSHTVTQGCNPATKNCGFGQQRPTYNQGQNQYSSSTYGESETDLSGGQSTIQSHTVTQTDSSQSYQPGHGSQFTCDLSKPNCGHDQQGQQTNYGKVCNVNDVNCRQTVTPVTKRPSVNPQPVCPTGTVGLQKHPTDCKKYLSCGSGQTFVMDCAAGTLFNEKTGMCDFPHNVKCELSQIDVDTSDTNHDDHWQRQYENNYQKFGQNAGHGNIRFTTEKTYDYNQQGIRDNDRGSTGYIKRVDVKQTPLNHDDIYDPNKITATTARSVHPPPFLTKDTNDLGETDYVFTYVNGDPVEIEPEDVIAVQERLTKSCDEESFHCSPNHCFSLTSVCDGIKDCLDGKDELNCQEYTKRFARTNNSKLVVPENQRFINVTHSTCAVLCIQNKKFTCRSFTYRKSDRTCFLSDKNIGMSGALQAHHSHDYYELIAGSIDCSDTSKYFECSNKKCLVKDHLCDGYTDCDDREDEKHCGPEKFGYKIKLVGSNQKNEGRVEVTAFNSTGYICDDDFSIVDANVICRELGFSLGAAEIKGQSQFAKDLKESNTMYMIDDLNCIGNESSIIDCSFPGWGIHNCRDQEIAGVVCKTPQEHCGDNSWKCDSGNECIPVDFVCDGVDDCADESDEAVQHCESPTELRLVGGSYAGEGRLEIRHNGIWGTVCDDDFNEDAAKVVCKSLGYKGNSIVKKEGFFGAGYGPIWLDQVSCFGNETELNKCTHWNWGEHNCEHNEDVGVICSLDAEDVKVERHSNLPVRIEESLPDKCGFRKDNQFAINDLIHARVVGGGVAKQGDYPWQAALKVRVKDKSAHWCGAIIISSRWVLTAAHCLQGYTKGAYIIVAGEYNTNEDEGTEQQKYIDEYFIHDKFRKGHKLNNDIALIKVKGGGFELNDDVQPICLADADTDYNRQLNCTISGFGSVKSGSSSYSHNLLAAWIPIHSQDICKMPHVYGDNLTDGMICAGSMDGGLDACDGDSGGPLACLDQGVFTLYGITSWGQHCGYANKPGVYVKVGHYRKWIEDTIAKHSN